MLEAAKRLDDHVVRRNELITLDTMRRLFYNKMGTPQLLVNFCITCMCIVGFTGFLQFGELSNIMNGDIIVFDTQLTLFIQKANTDQYREGRIV